MKKSGIKFIKYIFTCELNSCAESGKLTGQQQLTAQKYIL